MPRKFQRAPTGRRSVWSLGLRTFTVAWVAGGLAQPSAYHAADDAISDLGAVTARSAWAYNQIGANSSGILVVLLGLGLWRALSRNIVGRIGAGVLIAAGISAFRGLRRNANAKRVIVFHPYALFVQKQAALVGG